MNVVVNPKNEQEEKVLLAFLDSLNYQYQADNDVVNQPDTSFINQYNAELDLADQEVKAGDFLDNDEVVQLFKNRKKTFLCND